MNGQRFAGVGGSDYDLQCEFVPCYAKIEELVAETVAGFAGQTSTRVLDLGIGTGITAEAVLKKCPRIHLIGIDNELVMIRQASTKLARWNKRVKLVTKDALGYLRCCPTGSVDVICSAMTIHNFPQKYRQAVVKEMARVLRPGGLFVNGDKFAKDDLTARRRALRWQIRHFEAMRKIGRGDLAQYWIDHITLDDTAKLVMPEARAIQQMRRYGFTSFRRIYRKMQYAVVVAKRKK